MIIARSVLRQSIVHLCVTSVQAMRHVSHIPSSCCNADGQISRFSGSKLFSTFALSNNTGVDILG
jgi:hypothetical protein